MNQFLDGGGEGRKGGREGGREGGKKNTFPQRWTCKDKYVWPNRRQRERDRHTFIQVYIHTGREIERHKTNRETQKDTDRVTDIDGQTDTDRTENRGVRLTGLQFHQTQRLARSTNMEFGLMDTLTLRGQSVD